MCRELARHGLTPCRVSYPIHSSGPWINRPASPEAWRLLFAGRMDRLKGGHVFLEALARAKAGLDRALQVTFAGDSRARPLGASGRRRRTLDGRRWDRVRWVGWPGRLDALMAEANLLVVPSLWPSHSRPFGSPPKPGLPAAAFDVGGIPQWLVDGVNGALAPGHPPTADKLADAIVRCLADTQVHARLRTGAREIAGRFRMETHLTAVTRVLRDIATPQAAGGGRHAADEGLVSRFPR